MESVKMNKGKYQKRSLLTCFKAVVAVDDDDHNIKPQRRKKRGTTDPVLAYLAAADEDGVVLFPTAAKEEECGSRRRKRGRDAWHALRMAFYDTSLMKKILRIKKTKKDSTSRSNSNTESETINKLKSTRKSSTSNTSSNIANSPSLFSTTSSLNSTTSSNHDHMSNSSSHEVNNIPKPPPLKGTNCSVSKKISFIEDKTKRNIALCMLWIISLLVLILWGKFFAILCTSIWFYFVLFRQRRKFKGVGSYRESEFDYVQYKKKIIMEGLLERSHSRASLLTSASSSSMTKS